MSAAPSPHPSCEACKQYVENFTILRAEFEKQRSELEGTRRKHEQDKITIKQLEAKLQERTDDVIQVSQEKDMERARYKNAEETWRKLKELHGTGSKVGSELAALRQDSEKYLASLQGELQGQTLQLRAAREQMKALQLSLSQEQSAKQELQSELTATTARHTAAAEELRRATVDLRELQAAVIRKDTNLHRLETELAEMSTAEQHSKAELQRELQKAERRLQKETADQRKKIVALTKLREEREEAAQGLEGKYRQTMQREREDFQARLAEAAARQKETEERAAADGRDALRRNDALREENSTLLREVETLRSHRTELEAARADLTARCSRLEKAEGYAKAELRQLQDDKAKVQRELDRHAHGLTQAQTNEAKLSLLSMQLQYKEQELRESHQEKEAITAERAKIVSLMQKLVDKEKRVSSKCKKGQQKLVHVLNDFAVQHHQLEEKYKKLAQEYSSYKRNTEIRMEASAALGGTSERALPVSDQGFKPDQGIFAALAENFQRTSELEETRQHI